MPPVISICSICGNTSPPDAVFCINCGATLAQAATSTTRLLSVPRPPHPRWQVGAVTRARQNWRQLLITASVSLFGLALLTLLILVAYISSHRPGLDPVAWLFVLVGALHLVRGARRGEPLGGMRWAVLCAALPFAQVTQAFITTTVLFGGAFGLLTVLQFVVTLIPRRHGRP
jgi:hypothetical protein